MKKDRIEPGPGQESVWDYPRPPALVRHPGRVSVSAGGSPLAPSDGEAYRVLATSHPPTFYLPPGSIELSRLRENDKTTFCEWKGRASYYDLVGDDGRVAVADVGWFYKQPVERFAALVGHVCFYPSKVSAEVDGEAVTAQEGDFYGGWITSKVVGPFKGAAGTWGW